MARARSSKLGAAVLACTASLVIGVAGAGGPIVVRSNGAPYVWVNPAAISYRTDGGPLSPTVTEAAANARVDASFDAWQNVATATIAYSRLGAISATGAFTDGNVSTIAEYNAVQASCDAGTQSPVVYDANGSITNDLGLDNQGVIGFAGPCRLSGTQILSGRVVMNGLFQDGVAGNPTDLPAAGYDAAIVHEIGHFSGLDHSQINANCVDNICGADDLTGLPTMFPFLISSTQLSLSTDDIAWISRLYPATSGQTFAGTHGTITGTVLFTDGESHAQSVNVIARTVDAGANEDRRFAVSVISGFKFKAFHGNPITGDGPSQFGSVAPSDVGLFEIPVPAGNYTVEIESIHPEFVESSAIGPYALAMPGSAPAPIGPIAVAAGATVSVGNIVLLGTPPRFDQFEGP